jgi:hypothetical protein
MAMLQPKTRTDVLEQAVAPSSEQSETNLVTLNIESLRF